MLRVVLLFSILVFSRELSITGTSGYYLDGTRCTNCDMVQTSTSSRFVYYTDPLVCTGKLYGGSVRVSVYKQWSYDSVSLDTVSRYFTMESGRLLREGRSGKETSTWEYYYLTGEVQSRHRGYLTEREYVSYDTVYYRSGHKAGVTVRHGVLDTSYREEYYPSGVRCLVSETGKGGMEVVTWYGLGGVLGTAKYHYNALVGTTSCTDGRVGGSDLNCMR